MKRTIGISLILILAVFQLHAQDDKSEFLQKLESLEGVEVVGKTRFRGSFQEAYEIRLTQAVDHNYPTGVQFTQRLFIGFVGYDRPMVLSTSGYQAYGLGNAEPARLLNANLIRTEHRYFGESVPDPLVWDNLTVWQAASDNHRIVQTFKELFKGKWVSTGVSKDGQTTVHFKAIYPDDIDVAIPYVAPLNTGKVDPRIYEFLDNVGTADERKKILDYQFALFEKKEEIMPLIKELAEKNNWNFTMGIDDAVKAVEFLNPNKVIPMHYKTFDVIDVDPDEFVSRVKSLGKEAQVLGYGDSLDY